MDPALDSLGEPRFGPVVAGGADEAVASGWLEGLPGRLGEAWLSAAMASKDGSIVVVDRRLVGLRTKHVLEQMEGLELRQGLVVDLAYAKPDSVGGEAARETTRVETAFGESLVADAVVVAVGLGLGESSEGRWVSLSGGLRESLVSLGAELSVVSAEVGPSFGGEADFDDTEKLPVKRVRKGAGGWGEGGPASPYDVAGLWRAEVLVGRGEAEGEAILVAPDGVATGEVALTPGRVLAGQRRMSASRGGHTVRGLAVANVDGLGRLSVAGAPPVWVTGRAGGSDGYVKSLLSGVRTAQAVAEAMGGSAPRVGEVVGS